MSKGIIALQVVGFFIFSIPLYSKNYINLDDINEGLSAAKHSEFLEDSWGKLSIKEITQSEFIQGRFKKNGLDVPGFGFTKSAFWIRFNILNQTKENTIRYMEYDFAPTDKVELYIKGNKDEYLLKKGGDSLPFWVREVDFSSPIFSLPIRPGLNTFYLRIETTSALIVNLLLFDDVHLANHTSGRQLWFGVFYGILLVMIFYNFFVFVVIRDIIYLYYVIYIIAAAGFQFALNGLAFQYLWSESIWLANNAVTLFLGLNLFFAFIFSKSFLRINENSSSMNILMNVGLFCSAVGILLSFFDYYTAIRFETIILPFLMVTIFASGVVSFRNGRKEARYFLFAWFLFLVGAILKALHSNGFIQDSVIASSSYQVGLAWEVILLSLALADRLRMVRRKMDDVLNQSFLIQRRQTDELEKEVEKKTDEYLQHKEMLEKRKKAIDNELYIALSMQQKLIPAKNPVKYIASFYKPVIAVGGDLYDFILFENSNKLGIFICDVVGHGVAAALTTSVVKTLILQAGDKKERPDKFLEYINQTIINEFDFGFITMYYGILDPETRELVSCCAGHLPPILINGNTVEKINMPRTLPIGICCNEELNKKENSFVNHTYVLPVGSRVLFYTDGLSECESLANGGFFEDKSFEKVLIENGREKCHMIVHNLYEAVVSFRGSSQFEDDICILCLEVE